MHVQFLAVLVHLETIVEFDWGTPALATLYGHLSACSRGVSLSLGGHHRVLEVHTSTSCVVPLLLLSL